MHRYRSVSLSPIKIINRDNIPDQSLSKSSLVADNLESLTEFERNLIMVIREGRQVDMADIAQLEREIAVVRADAYQLRSECEWLWSWNRDLVEILACNKINIPA